MQVDSKMEAEPIFYGKNAVKFIEITAKPGEHCILNHWHERIELLYIQKGKLNVTIDRNGFTAFPGELVIIMPRQQHAGIAAETGVFYNVIMFDIRDLINNTYASERYLRPISKGNVSFLRKTANPEVIKAIKSILNKNGDLQSDSLMMLGNIYKLIALLYRHCKITEEINYQENHKFQNIIEYISIHYAEPITVSSIAGLFGYSEAYFCRQFKKISGTTPAEYIQFIRLNAAIEILNKSNAKISTIALSCGYENPAYFAKRFRKVYHMTPQEYRKESRKKQ